MKANLYIAVGLLCLGFSGKKDYCSDIKQKKDEFTGAVTSNSPTSENVAFYKEVRDSNTYYYVRLKSGGYSSMIGDQGAIILFDDTTKLSFPEAEISSSYIGNSVYQYTCFIAISASDLDEFAAHKIKAFRLYVHDHKMRAPQSERFQEYAKCISSP